MERFQSSNPSFEWWKRSEWQKGIQYGEVHLFIQGVHTSRVLTLRAYSSGNYSSKDNSFQSEGRNSHAIVRQTHAYKIAMRFWGKSSQLSGDIGETWMEYVAEYQQVGMDYNLTPSQKPAVPPQLTPRKRQKFYIDMVDKPSQQFPESGWNDQQPVQFHCTSKLREELLIWFASEYDCGIGDYWVRSAGEALQTHYKALTTSSPISPWIFAQDIVPTERCRGFQLGTEPLNRIEMHSLSFQRLTGSSKLLFVAKGSKNSRNERQCH